MTAGGRLAARNRTLRLCRPAMMSGMDKFALEDGGGGMTWGLIMMDSMKESESLGLHPLTWDCLDTGLWM